MKLFNQMPKKLSLALLCSSLLACGGSGGGSNASNTDQLAALLSTGADSSDTKVQWECTGSNGFEPVTFNQKIFSDGLGQIIQDGIPADFQWTVTGDKSISVTFPADQSGPEETFSINNIAFSTVNTANDKYDGTDSRNGSALSCQKPIEKNGCVLGASSLDECIL